MNTYAVEVNNHFLVRLEIEGSALAAEHYFLDGFKCVWGAMAYDEKAMKTDCFRGAVLNDELITLGLLETHLRMVDKCKEVLDEYDRKCKLINDEINRLLEEQNQLIDERNKKMEHYQRQFKRCNCKL